MPTHEVQNQVPPLVGLQPVHHRPGPCRGGRARGAGWAGDQAHRLGEILGSEEAIGWGFDANNNPPVLHTHDARGQRIDEVRFHPAWHELMRLSVSFGLHNLPWREPRAGAHVARAALFFLAGENEAGHGCPISMTYAAVPALAPATRRGRRVGAAHRQHAATTSDFCRRREKSACCIGMAMTEKQGGSDVRANTTRAVPAGRGGPGDEYRLTGHKWFCSAPMCDAFLVLAQAPGGLVVLSCCRAGRPRAQRNNFFIAAAEEQAGQSLERLERGRIRRCLRPRCSARKGAACGPSWRWSITRGSIARWARPRMMRQAVVQAMHHARHRAAFGRCWSNSR